MGYDTGKTYPYEVCHIKCPDSFLIVRVKSSLFLCCRSGRRRNCCRSWCSSLMLQLRHFTSVTYSASLIDRTSRFQSPWHTRTEGGVAEGAGNESRQSRRRPCASISTSSPAICRTTGGTRRRTDGTSPLSAACPSSTVITPRIVGKRAKLLWRKPFTDKSSTVTLT